MRKSDVTVKSKTCGVSGIDKRNRLMVKRIPVVLMVLTLMMTALTGCQLARPDAGEDAAGQAQRDRLVGVLVTDEYVELYDADTWLEDNLDEIIKGGNVTADITDVQKYQRRLYATMVERPLYDENGKQTSTATEYVFEGINAVMCYCATVYGENGEVYHTSYGDPGMLLFKNHIRTTDAGTFVEMEGTVYVAADGKDVIFEILPIYQDAAGNLFLTRGDSMALNTATEGMSMSCAYSENVEISDTSGTETTDGSSMKVSIEVVNRPQTVVVSQMDAESQLISRVEYPAGAVPEKLVPEAETSYIVVEMFKQGTEKESADRQMYDREDSRFRTMVAREDGFCEQIYTSIDWNK